MITRVASVYMLWMPAVPQDGVRGFWLNIANLETLDLNEISGHYIANMASGHVYVLHKLQKDVLDLEFHRISELQDQFLTHQN